VNHPDLRARVCCLQSIRIGVKKLSYKALISTGWAKLSGLNDAGIARRLISLEQIYAGKAMPIAGHCRAV